MKLGKWVLFLATCFAAPLTGIVVHLTCHEEPIDWILASAAFCFSISISLAFIFTLGYTLHDVLDLEPGSREDALTMLLTLMVSVPTLAGSFFLLCHLSLELGLIFASAWCVIGLMAYVRTRHTAAPPPAEESEYITSYLAPLPPSARLPIRDKSPNPNAV